MGSARLTAVGASGLAKTRVQVYSATSNIHGVQRIKLLTFAKRQVRTFRLSAGDFVTTRKQPPGKQGPISHLASSKALGQSKNFGEDKNNDSDIYDELAED